MEVIKKFQTGACPAFSGMLKGTGGKTPLEKKGMNSSIQARVAGCSKITLQWSGTIMCDAQMAIQRTSVFGKQPVLPPQPTFSISSPTGYLKYFYTSFLKAVSINKNSIYIKLLNHQIQKEPMFSQRLFWNALPCTLSSYHRHLIISVKGLWLQQSETKH